MRRETLGRLRDITILLHAPGRVRIERRDQTRLVWKMVWFLSRKSKFELRDIRLIHSNQLQFSKIASNAFEVATTAVFWYWQVNMRVSFPRICFSDVPTTHHF